MRVHKLVNSSRAVLEISSGGKILEHDNADIAAFPHQITESIAVNHRQMAIFKSTRSDTSANIDKGGHFTEILSASISANIFFT